MSKVLYEKTGRIGRITLNRPDVLNAIDDEVPELLSGCVAEANADPDVHAIILSGNGPAFCAGYDLTFYAEGNGSGDVTQEMPWDPMKDYAFMSRNTDHFMSLWRSHKPVVCKVHGHAVAGGSDIAKIMTSNFSVLSWNCVSCRIGEKRQLLIAAGCDSDQSTAHLQQPFDMSRTKFADHDHTTVIQTQ
ncbi:MAG: enoyl-CoA hydratase-related protein [Pseudomonadota bacterium]